MADPSRSQFHLRRDTRNRNYRLIYRYPLANPEARHVLAPALATLRAETQARGESWRPPNQITIGVFTPHGFRPLRRWLLALRIPVVRDRICEDAEQLYGPGGDFAEMPVDA